MTKPKSLFKLARNRMFEKEYLCREYVNLDENFMQKYGKYIYCYVIKIFICKKCNMEMGNNEIIYHAIRCNEDQKN